MTGALYMLRCKEMGLSDADLADMTMGMVYDLAIEKANDAEEYPLKATKENIAQLFGGG